MDDDLRSATKIRQLGRFLLRSGVLVRLHPTALSAWSYKRGSWTPLAEIPVQIAFH